VILEELKQADSILLHDLLNLDHECMMILLTIKISKSVTECGLGSRGVAIDHVLEAVGIAEEVSIPDRIVLISINEGNSIDLIFINLETKCVEDLSEDLGADLKVPKRVPILEEALRVKSIFSDNFTEVFDDLLAEVSLSLVGLSPSVNSLCAHLTYLNVEVLLETLLGEDLVDSVGEFPPLDVLTFLWCLEHGLKHVELALRNGALGHGESNSELLGSDEARPESIEVSEEL
jgi:hypothetical protein